MIFPFCENIDFVNVIAVKTFLCLLQIDIPDELCMKVCRPSQRNLLFDADAICRAPPEPEADLVDSPEIYQSEEDGRFDGEGNGSSGADDGELMRFIPSLTPFYLLNLAIPDDLFVPSLIWSFCMYSVYRMKEDEWILNFAGFWALAMFVQFTR
jgi:hypothetical protein